jgi:toxin CptA
MGAWLLLAHAAAATVLPFVALPLPVVLLVAAGILYSLCRYWPRQASRTSAGAIRTLSWDSDWSCQLQLQGGESRRATLCQQAFVQPWLVILQLSEGGRSRRCLVIMPDMLDGESFRRLRVRLMMQLGQAHGPG